MQRQAGVGSTRNWSLSLWLVALDLHHIFFLLGFGCAFSVWGNIHYARKKGKERDWWKREEKGWRGGGGGGGGPDLAGINARGLSWFASLWISGECIQQKSAWLPVLKGFYFVSIIKSSLWLFEVNVLAVANIKLLQKHVWRNGRVQIVLFISSRKGGLHTVIAGPSRL